MIVTPDHERERHPITAADSQGARYGISLGRYFDGPVGVSVEFCQKLDSTLQARTLHPWPHERCIDAKSKRRAAPQWWTIQRADCAFASQRRDVTARRAGTARAS